MAWDVEVLYLESALVQRALIAGNIAMGQMTGSLDPEDRHRDGGRPVADPQFINGDCVRCA
jgi:hypothetical protein